MVPEVKLDLGTVSYVCTVSSTRTEDSGVWLRRSKEGNTSGQETDFIQKDWANK